MIKVNKKLDTKKNGLNKFGFKINSVDSIIPRYSMFEFIQRKNSKFQMLSALSGKLDLINQKFIDYKTNLLNEELNEKVIYFLIRSLENDLFNFEKKLDTSIQLLVELFPTINNIYGDK